MKGVHGALVALAFLILALWLPQDAPSEVAHEDDWADVVRVVDGDTIVVNENGDDITVRVLGIDTPETVDPRRPVECFGQEASSEMSRLVSGQAVGLVSDTTQGDTDKYGRLLRYIELNDGTDVGLALIQQGFAQEFTYDVPRARQAAYQAAEASSRAAGSGLWAPDACK